jgi:hypothetical protein
VSRRTIGESSSVEHAGSRSVGAQIDLKHACKHSFVIQVRRCVELSIGTTTCTCAQRKQNEEPSADVVDSAASRLNAMCDRLRNATEVLMASLDADEPPPPPPPPRRKLTDRKRSPALSENLATMIKLLAVAAVAAAAAVEEI